MSIDEAIEKNRKIAETKKTLYDACILEEYNRHLLREYKEHEQLAQWLEDYKHIKQWKSDIMDEFCKHDVSSFEELIANARNKAIDDFVKFASTMPTVEEEDGTIRPMWLEEMAEQLKTGELNEQT